MTNEWQDHLAGARMRVDQQFEQQVADSQFSSQEWGLIMTAVEFDIRSAENPEDAVLVAKTEKLEAIGPELARIQKEQGSRSPMGMDDDSGGGGLFDRLGGLFSSVTGSSGGGPPGGNERQLEEARVLVDDYADHLQAFLEKQDRWAEVCAMAAESDA